MAQSLHRNPENHRTTPLQRRGMLTRLQILRAFAAYAVVVFHWCEGFAYEAGFHIPGAYAGAAGVDLFFVISGFVMVYVAGERDGPGRFMFDRIARILPLYFVATMGIIVAHMIRPWLFSEADLSPASLVSAMLFIPSFNLTGGLSPPLPVGWTLNFEMMFYALFALSMFARPAWRVPIVLVLISVLFTAGLLTPRNYAFRFYGDPVMFEFALGCAIGWLVNDRKRRSAMARIPAWVYVAIGVAIFLINENLLGAFPNRLVRWGIPAAFVVTGFVLLDLTRPKAAKGLLVSLGDSSYSAYLLHLFVIIAVGVAVGQFFTPSPMSHVISFVLSVTGVAIASALSHKFIEIPARDFLRRRFPMKRAKVAAERS